MLGAIVGNSIARGFGVDETAGIDWSRHACQCQSHDHRNLSIRINVSAAHYVRAGV